MSFRPDLSSAHWVKSSHSSDGGQCVEIAPGFPSVFPADAWQAFVTAVRAGEFGAN
ncbi:DUF397 domain-containing protein [Kitasatospora sp. NPDC059817]|uniref:DUF397 domain-containing protein n=1 Tax=Kitasatospora sp. NPDC059817 TaxID=3346961 RepID=UPI0036561589